MTRVASAGLTFVDVPIKRPLRNSRGGLRSARRWILRLTTDDGLVGWGDFAPRGVAGTAPDAASEALATLRGVDVFDTTSVRMRLGGGKFPDQAAAIFLAGVEMALLDLQGKAIGRPVHDLLGGARRGEIPLIAYIFRTTAGPGAPEPEPRDLAAQAIDEFGFATVKLKAGAAAPEADVAAAETIRERFPATALRIDPSGSWSVPQTMRLARRLAALDLEWLEDPVLTTHAMHQVRTRTAFPLATNMCLTSPWELPEAVARQPVDVVLLDLWFLGGLRASMEFERALDAFKLAVGIHAGGGSPALGVSQAAALHLAAALPRLDFAADSLYHHLADDVLTAPHRIAGGSMRVPTGPGLGVEVDEEKLKRYEIVQVRP